MLSQEWTGYATVDWGGGITPQVTQAWRCEDYGRTAIRVGIAPWCNPDWPNWSHDGWPLMSDGTRMPSVLKRRTKT